MAIKPICVDDQCNDSGVCVHASATRVSLIEVKPGQSGRSRVVFEKWAGQSLSHDFIIFLPHHHISVLWLFGISPGVQRCKLNLSNSLSNQKRIHRVVFRSRHSNLQDKSKGFFFCTRLIIYHLLWSFGILRDTTCVSLIEVTAWPIRKEWSCF